MDQTPTDLVEFFTDSCDTLQLGEFIKEGLGVNEPLSLEDGRRPLHVAATSGNVDMVEALLELGVDLDLRDYRGNTALHYAAREGHVTVVRLLLHREADVNLMNDEECSILQNAVCFEHLEVTRRLLFRGANFNAVVSTGSLPLRLQEKSWYFDERRTLLCLAFELGNVPIVQEMILVGANVVAESHKLMYIAIREESVELVKLLMEKGVKPTLEGIDGKTPLECAASIGWYSLVEMFLDIRADTERGGVLQGALDAGHLDIAKLLVKKGHVLSSEIKLAALSNVLRKEHTDVANWLFNHGPNANLSQEDYTIFLIKAITNGNIELARLIIDKVDDINAVRGNLNNKKTALIAATEKRLLPLIILLLEKGASPMVCASGVNALSYAIRNDTDLELIKIFLTRGVSVNAFVDTEKTTLLHWATTFCRADVVEFLLQRGADINAKDANGCTPFHKIFMISNRENLSIIKQLVASGADLYHNSKFDLRPIDVLIRDKHWLMGTAEEVERERLFVQEYYQILEEDLVKFSDLLCNLIQKLHTDLVKPVLQKIIGFYYEKESTSFDAATSNVNIDYGFGLLHLAAYKGDADMARAALQRGENINNMTKEGFTSLQIALYKDNTELAQYLIFQGASVSIQDRLGLLPFHVALVSGCNDTLVTQLYFETCLKNYSTTVFGVPLLHFAACTGSISLVEFFLSEGLNINVTNQKNNTILHIAVKMQNCELVDFLLKKGIDKNAQDMIGDTALHMAVQAVYYKSVGLEIPLVLLKHDVDINIPNFNNATVLHLAVATPLAGALLKKGVRDVNARSKCNSTPIQNLADELRYKQEISYDATHVVALFLQYKADISVKRREWESPLLVLCQSKVVDIKRIAELCNTRFSSIMDYDQISSFFEKLSYNNDEQFSRKRQSDLVEILLKEGFSFNNDNEFLLNHIMKDKNTYLFSPVLEHDSNLDLKRVLSKAIKERKLHHLKLILDKIDLNTSDNHFYLNMFFPEEGLKYGLAQMFLDRIKMFDASANFALLVQVAKAEHCLSLVKALLDKGVNINSIDAQSNTALHYASYLGSKKLLCLLLSRGAYIDPLNNKNQTPIYFAVKAGRLDEFNVLVDHGASFILTVDDDGNTLLHKATCGKIAQILIERGVPVNARNLSERTALHCIVDPDDTIDPSQVLEYAEFRIKTQEIASLLIKSGALVNVQDRDKITPLHLAAKNDFRFILKMVLIKNGADIDSKDKDGRTPLHHAVDNLREVTIQYLLDAGAQAYAEDNSGQSPYSMSRISYTVSHIFLAYWRKEQLINQPSDYIERLHIDKQLKASCLEELERIKRTKLETAFSLFEIFSALQKPTYLHDEQVVRSIKKLFSSDLTVQFPHYGGILKSTFARAYRSRYYLSHLALDVVFFKKQSKLFLPLPMVVWRNVLRYLSDKELENVIEIGNILN